MQKTMLTFMCNQYIFLFFQYIRRKINTIPCETTPEEKLHVQSNHNHTNQHLVHFQEFVEQCKFQNFHLLFEMKHENDKTWFLRHQH